MLQYPSIPGFGEALSSGSGSQRLREAERRSAKHKAQGHIGLDCIAFVKYDGSNLRWEWSPKQGWHKFGTRKTMFDERTPFWKDAIPLFMDTMADEIVRRSMHVEGKKLERITAFTEYFGPSSFAGFHVESEPKELRLFDVSLFKKGFIKPQQFVELFGKLPYAAEVVYRGPMSVELRRNVYEGKYGVDEGVICKGLGEEFTYKLKTAAWYTRLKERYADKWEQYA